VALLALAITLAGHSALRYSASGQLDLTEMDGLFMYGRVGEIADCKKAPVSVELRPLCPSPEIQPPRSRDPVDFFLWDPQSPPRRVFGDPYRPASPQERDVENQQMRRFALEIVRQRPLVYAKVVTADFLRFFRPGVMSTLPGYDHAITFPRDPRPIAARFEVIRARVIPDYTPRTRAPAGALVAYQRWVHTPRWLLGGLVLASLLALLLAVAGCRRVSLPRIRETFLLVGAGLGLLVVAANWHFEPRYLVPAVPLLVAGGVLAVTDLASAARGTRIAGRFRHGGPTPAVKSTD
jgi:hypothetical protein